VTPLLGGDTVANIVDVINADPAANLLVLAREGAAGNITLAQGATNLFGGVDSMTNGRTYRIKKYLGTNQIVLDAPSSFPDANNGAIEWTVHDGYLATLSHSHLRQGSLDISVGIGDVYTGGRRRPVEGLDYTVNIDTGVITQIGRHAGTWGQSPPAYISYYWYLEVLSVTAGAGVLDSTDTEVMVNETAMWAPDVLVDRFNLYNNYGYLINRFEPSSETYREFIRGVFQLYILGPTLERLESALNVIAGFPVIRDDDDVLQNYDTTSDPDYNIVTTLRPNGDTATYQYPKSLALRADVQNPANYGVLTFESFEPLTLAFQVSDHVQDPSWWTDIIIPRALMPKESTQRRRILGALIENIIGAWDNPRIGDPGFIIGADDEGNIPTWKQDLQLDRLVATHVSDQIFAATRVIRLGNGGFTAADEGYWVRISNSSNGNNGDYKIGTVISGTDVLVTSALQADEGTGFLAATDGVYYEDTTPALRRKMSNVVMERFLRWNIFFVRFDATLIDVIDPDFIDDLIELILVAKPGYRYMYTEPFNRLEDVMLITEDAVDIDGRAVMEDAMVLGEDALTLQSFSWDIGDNWRFRTPVTGQALVVADGISIPNGGAAIVLGEDRIITKFLKVGGVYTAIREDEDYDFDYTNGTLTPTTVWPAGTYTIDFHSVRLTGTPNVALGDTPFIIGGLDPTRVRNRREHIQGCSITTVGGAKILTLPDVSTDLSIGLQLSATLHNDAYIQVYGPASMRGRHRILRVSSSLQAVLYPDNVVNATDVEWAFPSEEPTDGEIFDVGSGPTFESPSAIFRTRHLGRYIHIKDAVNGANNKRHKIIEVVSMSRVRLAAGAVPEADLHWRLEGTEQAMDIVERPLQITIT
jgi:hypothetical protein